MHLHVYAYVNPGPSPIRTEELYDGVLVDLDEHGGVIGVEILCAVAVDTTAGDYVPKEDSDRSTGATAN